MVKLVTFHMNITAIFFLDMLCMYRMNSVALLKIYSMRLGVLSE